MTINFAKFAYCVLALSLAESGEFTGSLNEETFLLQLATSRTTPTLPGPHCLATGDPHIKPFDESGEEEKCLGAMGDYVLVKTADFWVHGRYMGFQRDGGYAFIRGLVIGGARLGGLKLSVPVLNSGEVLFNDSPIPANGLNFDAGNGDSVHIWKAPGPTLVGFEVEDLTNTDWRNTFWIELKKNGVVDVLIVINQGGNQHIMISGTQAALHGTAGQCGNNNGDPSDDTIPVDDCPGRVPPSSCEFPVCPNPEDGTPREPSKCVQGSTQYLFYTELCKNYWESEIETKPWKLFNCVTDCCGDRDSCPDMGDSGFEGTCLLKGDPHIKVFDSPTVRKHVYGPLDDYWIVKAKDLSIQARYGSKRWDGKAQIMGVAIAGVLTDGVTVFIPEGHGPAQIDGTEMTGDNYTTDAFELEYDSEGENLKYQLDGKPSKDLRPLFTLTFLNPAGDSVGTVQVNRNVKEQHRGQLLFIRAQNWILDGVSGQCGNFNGNSTDDEGPPTSDAVKANETLFTTKNAQKGQMNAQASCSTQQVKQASKCCDKKHSPTSVDVIQSCVTDHCCGSQKGCDPTTHCKDPVTSPKPGDRRRRDRASRRRRRRRKRRGSRRRSSRRRKSRKRRRRRRKK